MTVDWLTLNRSVLSSVESCFHCFHGLSNYNQFLTYDLFMISVVFSMLSMRYISLPLFVSLFISSFIQLIYALLTHWETKPKITYIFNALVGTVSSLPIAIKIAQHISLRINSGVSNSFWHRWFKHKLIEPVQFVNRQICHSIRDNIYSTFRLN